MRASTRRYSCRLRSASSVMPFSGTDSSVDDESEPSTKGCSDVDARHMAAGAEPPPQPRPDAKPAVPDSAPKQGESPAARKADGPPSSSSASSTSEPSAKEAGAASADAPYTHEHFSRHERMRQMQPVLETVERRKAFEGLTTGGPGSWAFLYDSPMARLLAAAVWPLRNAARSFLLPGMLSKLESMSERMIREEVEYSFDAQEINIEYNVSYVYHALYAYFNRDNVALPGMAAFFKAGSEEERDHAELLMDYQCKRGGQVVLGAISMPVLNVAGSDKGDALYAMELALSLEKLNFQKLRHLHSVADENGDASMADFIEGDLLAEQVDAVKAVSEYVSQLRRVGKGLGVYQFDKQLAAAVAAAPPA
ncbi:Ferritin-2, chloroplastic [Tetrabaena socialis]|uniref:Ferritin n=1 Tax=Tetrabaena socialis TaxID=47790 RepID=A0A2J7ZXH5_9CHLO|nr:Ferritin-2, chloroplastic [Tetrabaena socialis]|eukprot:PNH04981.1 Ferritin-2, chloroplastic [Tetrabaena socialis]